MHSRSDRSAADPARGARSRLDRRRGPECRRSCRRYTSAPRHKCARIVRSSSGWCQCRCNSPRTGRGRLRNWPHKHPLNRQFPGHTIGHICHNDSDRNPGSRKRCRTRGSRRRIGRLRPRNPAPSHTRCRKRRSAEGWSPRRCTPRNRPGLCCTERLRRRSYTTMRRTLRRARGQTPSRPVGYAGAGRRSVKCS